MVLRPDLYNRDCADCRTWWYDDEGKPVTRNGTRLKRPCPPACHRCKKYQLGIQELSAGNEWLYDVYTDLQLELGVPELSEGMRAALRTVHRTLTQAERRRLALDLAEVLHGSP